MIENIFFFLFSFPKHRWDGEMCMVQDWISSVGLWFEIYSTILNWYRKNMQSFALNELPWYINFKRRFFIHFQWFAYVQDTWIWNIQQKSCINFMFSNYALWISYEYFENCHWHDEKLAPGFVLDNRTQIILHLIDKDMQIFILMNKFWQQEKYANPIREQPNRIRFTTAPLRIYDCKSSHI